MYEGLTCEELQNALEYEKARNGHTYDDGYKQDALKCLLTQHEPLKPPYSQEELLVLKDAMPPGTDLPPQFVEYLTQVSREMVFYDDVEQADVSSLRHHVKEITTCIQFETTGVRNWGDDDNREEVDSDDEEVDSDDEEVDSDEN